MNHNERNGETQVGNIEWRAHGCARGGGECISYWGEKIGRPLQFQS